MTDSKSEYLRQRRISAQGGCASGARLRRRNSQSAGFTLVEMLVAAGIFSMVVLTLTGAFLAAFRSQRSAFAFLHMQNNIRHVLEVMGREMRTGREFSLPTLMDPSRIRFTTDRNVITEYCMFGGAVRKQTGGEICGDRSLPMTADNVRVEHLEFLLAGAAVDDGRQPRVTILLSIATVGRLGEADLSADLQLTVTQRDLDS